MHNLTKKDVMINIFNEPENDILPEDSLTNPEDIRQVNLERGWNSWAWCTVTVRATYYDTVTQKEYIGEDYLHGCSYADAAAFMAEGGYYESMVESAINNLQGRMSLNGYMFNDKTRPEHRYTWNVEILYSLAGYTWDGGEAGMEDLTHRWRQTHLDAARPDLRSMLTLAVAKYRGDLGRDCAIDACHITMTRYSWLRTEKGWSQTNRSKVFTFEPLPVDNIAALFTQEYIDTHTLESQSPV